MFSIKKLVVPAALTAASFACMPSFADNNILEGFSYTNAYARGGFNTAPSNRPDGGYSLGGSLQKFRLGNEMDQYFEVLLNYGQKMDDGLAWGLHWMPAVGNGNLSNYQVFANVTGASFAPDLVFWAGQRYHRIQDIHIVDNWIMQDGDNLGGGVDNINVGFGKLNVAIHGSDNTGDKAASDGARHNNARRFNFQWVNMPLYEGGSLTLTGGVMTGKFGVWRGNGTRDDNEGGTGVAGGLLYRHAVPQISGENQLFVQVSQGHLDIDGKFYNLGTNNGTANFDIAGAKQFRIADVFNFQYNTVGAFLLVGYHSRRTDNNFCSANVSSNPCKFKDFSLGGRVSWGFARHLKLLGELGFTSRKVDDADIQNLNKATVALAISPNAKDRAYPEFWSRPEFRLFVSYANWNDAAAEANGTNRGAGFAGANADGQLRKNVAWGGVQFETWF